MPPTRIETLTALRGIAALWVVVFHVEEFLLGNGVAPLLDRGATQIVARGYLFVDLFFLLSGFVICHVYGGRLFKRDPEEVRRYLRARFAKLYPVHLVMLLLHGIFIGSCFLISPTYASSWLEYYSLYSLVAQLFLSHAVGIDQSYSWNFVSWSIAAEWWTYVLAVVLIPKMIKFRWVAIVGAVVLGVLALWWLYYLPPGETLNHGLDKGLIRCVAEFGIGVAVYQIYRRVVAVPGYHRLAMPLALSGCFIACYFLHTGTCDVGAVGGFAVLILGVALLSEQTLLGRVLLLPPLQFLGRISYSIYMMQILIIYLWVVLRDHGLFNGGPFVSLVAILSVLIPASWLMYRFVEVPAQRFLR